MAKIVGLEGVTPEQLQAEVMRGGKFVVFPYVISALVITFSRNSDIYFVRANESTLSKGWQFALMSLFLGWWGFPWGIIRTPIALVNTLSGGKDVTREVMATILRPTPVPQQGMPAFDLGPQNRGRSEVAKDDFPSQRAHRGAGQ